VVTGLCIIAIAIPALLWLTWRRNADGARDDTHPSFRDWRVGRKCRGAASRRDDRGLAPADNIPGQRYKSIGLTIRGAEIIATSLPSMTRHTA
jgi:hypothetical protein